MGDMTMTMTITTITTTTTMEMVAVIMTIRISDHCSGGEDTLVVDTVEVVVVYSADCSDGEDVDTTIRDTLDTQTIRMGFVDYPNSSTTSDECPASTATVPHIRQTTNGISAVQCMDSCLVVHRMHHLFTNLQVFNFCFLGTKKEDKEHKTK